MGCGCNKNKAQAPIYYSIQHQDGTVRRYLTSAEAEAAVRASESTANPAKLVSAPGL